LKRCWTAAPVRTVDFPGADLLHDHRQLSLRRHLSIEFRDDAPDDEQPRLGAWLELRADDPAVLLQTTPSTGLVQVRHPGHPYYFMIPGGQVFAIKPAH
jgi:hypothetical protein